MVESALLGGARCDRLRVQGIDTHGEVLGVAGADVGLAQDERAKVGHRRGRVRRNAARVRDGVLGDLDLRGAGGTHPLRDGCADRSDPLRLCLGRRDCGLLMERRGRGDRLGVGDAGPLVVGTARARESGRIAERTAEIWRLEGVRRHDAHRLADDRPHGGVGLVGDGVLVDRAVRVARDRGAAAMHVDVGLVRRCIAQRLAKRREEPVRAKERHSRTSMGTSRKRACAAPWPTRIS